MVDPVLVGHGRGSWPSAEPFGVGVVGRGQGGLPGLVDRAGGAEMHRGGRVLRYARMVMNVVVFVEESGAELAGVRDRFEVVREVRNIFQGFEL